MGAEKMELQSALEEAEATLEQEENKVLRMQMELSQVKTEIERRIAEKDEEFAMVRKNQSKALDSMQSALETEAKGKAEANRMKKKLEADAGDLGLALEHAIAGNAETQTTIKKYQLQVRDAQVKVDDESQSKSAAADAKVSADRKLLEAQCKDTGARADEAEVNALKGGRKAMIKMETRIRELESELDAETRRNSDVMKNLRKAERSIKELTFGGDEDKKNHERMQSLIDQLQGKVKSYKKQIEEAEEIAALNLAKYRKVAGALGDAAAAADAAEQEAAMRKARARSASLV